MAVRLHARALLVSHFTDTAAFLKIALLLD